VEDNEGRELDVSRKEKVFKPLTMFKIRSFLMPFTTAQVKYRQKKISLHKRDIWIFPVCM